MPTVTFTFEQFNGWLLDVAVFTGCAATAALRAEVQRKDTDIILLDACLVPGTWPLRLAAHRALHTLHVATSGRGKLSAASLHAEVVYALQGGRNVGEALRLLGPGEGCRATLVARLVRPDGNVEFAGTEAWAAHLGHTLQGTPVNPRMFFGEEEKEEDAGAGGGGVGSASLPHLDVPAALAAYRLTAEDASLLGGLALAVVSRTALQDVGGWA